MQNSTVDVVIIALIFSVNVNALQLRLIFDTWLFIHHKYPGPLHSHARQSRQIIHNPESDIEQTPDIIVSLKDLTQKLRLLFVFQLNLVSKSRSMDLTARYI